MVYLAVRDVPAKFTLAQVVQHLARVIQGNVFALNFGSTKGDTKVCYVKVTNRLDPEQVLSAIRKTRFKAHVVDNVPAQAWRKGGKEGKAKIARGTASNSQSADSPDTVFVITHRELLTEIQMKYTGLYNLSKKTGHKLLAEIARTLFERLKQVSDLNPDCLQTGFKLSGAYRRLHPHFGDFQLILSTLHKLQDAAAAPRAQLSESDLIQPLQPSGIDNVPFDKVQSACNKYADKISKKISDHVTKLDAGIEAGDSEEEIARKRVREELKKLNPYLSNIIKEVISNHFVPRKAPFPKIRIYGEPFMPNKEVMAPVLRKYRAVTVHRSDRMFNLLRFSVPMHQTTALMAMDGTVVGGAKLVIRSSDANMYIPPPSFVREMRAAFGVTQSDDLVILDEVLPEDEEMES